MSDIGESASNARDTTERDRAEEMLRQSESRFRAQYKGLPIPVYTWQRSGDDFVLIDYNHAAEEITQGNVVHLLGAKASSLYQDAPDILEEMWQCFREQSSFQRDMLYQFRSTSDTKHLSVSYGFVPPDIVLVHTADVTKRVEAERVLELSFSCSARHVPPGSSTSTELIIASSSALDKQKRIGEPSVGVFQIPG